MTQSPQISNRRKVCFVLPSLAGGGAERAAVQILNALEGSTWDRSMYLFKREGPYLAELSPEVALTCGGSDSRLGRWRELSRFIATTQPDVVVSFLSYFTVLSAVRAALTRTRVVFHQQTPMTAFLDDADYQWRGAWRKRAFTSVTRLGYAAADLVIASSRGVAQDLTSGFGVDPSRVRVVGNPVDIDAVTASAAEPLSAQDLARWTRPVIVAAGRLADAKNYPLLIEAVAHLRARLPVRLFVLGQGERGEALMQLAQQRGLGYAIVWCGFQANPWKFMSRADVFALTSRYEGFGNVLIEAMACGVTVVATSSPGTQDIIHHGVDGLLVREHTATAVADALFRVLTDEPARMRLAAAARFSAQRFARPVVARRYGAVLLEALGVTLRAVGIGVAVGGGLHAVAAVGRDSVSASCRWSAGRGRCRMSRAARPDGDVGRRDRAAGRRLPGLFLYDRSRQRAVWDLLRRRGLFHQAIDVAAQSRPRHSDFTRGRALRL